MLSFASERAGQSSRPRRPRRPRPRRVGTPDPEGRCAVGQSVGCFQQQDRAAIAHPAPPGPDERAL